MKKIIISTIVLISIPFFVQGKLHLLPGDEAVALGVGKLIEVDDAHGTVRIDDHVGEKIRNDVGVRFRVPGVGNDVAVPADQAAFMVVEFAHLEAALEKVAGEAVMERLLGAQRLPPRDDDFPVAVQDDIALQKDTLVGNDAAPVQTDRIHGTRHPSDYTILKKT